MSVTSQSPLVVPVDLAAVCVGSDDAKNVTNNSEYFAGTTTTYTNMTGNDLGFLGANINRGLAEPPLVETALEKGIHLHWALPDALTHGAVGDESLNFKPAPNRWLVVRFQVDSTGTPGTPRGWVVMSDRLNAEAPTGQTSITLPVQAVADGELISNYAGEHAPFESWSEPDIPVDQGFKSLTGGNLNTVSGGQSYFAAYYPNNRGVFGFVDEAEDIESTADLAYAVFGWYAGTDLDPLGAGVSLATLQTDFGWTFRGQADDEVASTLCQGLVQGVAWDSGRQYFSTDQQRPTISAELVVANNAAEAFSAYFQDKLGLEQSPYFQQLLTSFQQGTLSKYTSSELPDRLAQLDESLHQAEFSPVNAGSIYSIAVHEEEAADAPAPPTPPLSPKLAEALNDLNIVQQQANFYNYHKQEFQLGLFVDWYRLFKAEPGDSRNAAVDAVSYKIRNWQAMQDAWFKAADGENPASGLQVELAAALKKVNDLISAANASQKSQLELVSEPAGRYYQPNEPFLLLTSDALPGTFRYGGDGRHHSEGYLMCRVGDQALTGIQIGGVDIAGSRFGQMKLPANPALPWATQVNGLLVEACLLNSSIAHKITGTAAATIEEWVESALTDAVNQGDDVSSANVTFVGIPPTPVSVQWWGPDNPLLPILLSWTAKVAPMLDTEYPQGTLHDYPNSFFVDNYDIAPDAGGTISLKSSPKIDVNPGAASAYTQNFAGTSILGRRSGDTFEKQLTEYLQNNPDPTLQTIHDDLTSTAFHGQSLLGFNQLMLMLEPSLQLPVRVPKTGSGDWYETVKQLTELVAPIVGGNNRVAPLFNGSFNPIRSGYMKLELEVIGAFGERRDIAIDKFVTAESMSARYQGQAVPEVVNLPPRYSQPLRLIFRWLAAAGQQDEEMNSHPASSPICGWVMPNHLDGSLFFYDQQGKSLGTLFLNGDESAVEWQSAPGDDSTVNQSLSTVMQRANPHLAAVAEKLQSAGADDFKAFWKAIDKMHAFVNPHTRAGSQDLAVLVGRPVALVQCQLRLETQGPVEINQSFTTLQGAMVNKTTSNKVEQVKQPLLLGNLEKLNDGLIGFFRQDSSHSSYDLNTFYCEGADPQATTGTVQPQATTLELTLSPASSHNRSQLDVPEPPNNKMLTEQLLMFVDPRAPIHATSGILPTEKLLVPPAQYSDALANLEMTFLATPILRPNSGLTLPLPTERGYTWSWVQEQPDPTDAKKIRWYTDPALEQAAGRAVWGFTPQVLAEGWLRLSPDLLEFELLNSAGHPVVVSGNSSNDLTLSLRNKKTDTLSFVAGTPVAEGTPPKGSLFYIHLSHLLSSEEIEGIELSAHGWEFSMFEDAQYGKYWAAAPSEDCSLEAGKSLSIQMNNVHVSSGRSQAYVYFDYYGLGGLNDGAYDDLLTIQPKS